MAIDFGPNLSARRAMDWSGVKTSAVAATTATHVGTNATRDILGEDLGWILCVRSAAPNATSRMPGAKRDAGELCFSACSAVFSHASKEVRTLHARSRESASRNMPMRFILCCGYVDITGWLLNLTSSNGNSRRGAQNAAGNDHAEKILARLDSE